MERHYSCEAVKWERAEESRVLKINNNSKLPLCIHFSTIEKGRIDATVIDRQDGLPAPIRKDPWMVENELVAFFI